MPPPVRPSLSAAVQLDEVTSAARAHLERANAFLADGQWDEAISTLIRATEEQPDKLIRLDDASSVDVGTFVSLRAYGQWWLSTVGERAPEALAIYRRQVDPLAQRWLQQAVAGRDEPLLRRVVEELFASSYGDDALFALGELLLERGHYAAARCCWECLHPSLRTPDGGPLQTPAGLPLWVPLRDVDLGARWPELEPVLRQGAARPTWLVYPDTDLPLAAIRARLVLVSVLEGDRRRAEVELELLRRFHPDARGPLGGQEVQYVEALAQRLEESRHWPHLPGGGDWPTFAGAADRNGSAPAGADWALQPAWSVALGPGRRADRLTERSVGLVGRRSAERWDALCSYYPIVTDGLVLLQDANRIVALDLGTGMPAWPGTEGGTIYRPPLARSGDETPHLGVPRYTLTADHQRLFTRLGTPRTLSGGGDLLPRDAGYLIGLDLRAEGKLLPGFPIHPESPSWAFDGCPVTDGSRLYVVMRHSDVRGQLHLACFDAASGRLRWRRLICTAESLGRGEVDEFTHTLLTLRDDVVYCNTNLGAVAAVSAGDGRVQWVTRYPRQLLGWSSPQHPLAHVYRDLNPCLFDRGRLFVAPADHEQIIALDAATGRWLWQTRYPSGMLDAVHLLGASGDRLVAGGRRLWWIDIHTGRPADGVVENPFPAPARPDPVGLGRGLLAGDHVYWPARGEQDELHVLDLQTGRPVRQPIPLSLAGAAAGNLVVAGEYLLVASPGRLFAFHGAGRRSPQASPPEMPIPGSAASHVGADVARGPQRGGEPLAAGRPF